MRAPVFAYIGDFSSGSLSGAEQSAVVSRFSKVMGSPVTVFSDTGNRSCAAKPGFRAVLDAVIAQHGSLVLLPDPGCLPEMDIAILSAVAKASGARVCSADGNDVFVAKTNALACALGLMWNLPSKTAAPVGPEAYC